ncbi:hypothetical protein ACHAXH_002849 [Discostella pseudostelligera]
MGDEGRDLFMCSFVDSAGSWLSMVWVGDGDDEMMVSYQSPSSSSQLDPRENVEFALSDVMATAKLTPPSSLS